MKNFIIVTGATSGFGEATARLFAENGWNLILTGRREERLAQLKAELLTEHNEILTLCFDVRDEQAVEDAFAAVPLELRDRVAVLVNNAGLAVGRGPIQSGVTDDWERMIDTNIKGLLYVSKAVIPWLRSNKGGVS